MSTHSELEAKFNKSRGNLILVFAFSVANIVMYLLEASFYFPFSAVFPSFAMGFGQGMTEEYGAGAYFIAGIFVGVVAASFYLICWLFSKKHKEFLLVALVLFCIDSLFLLWIAAFGFEASLLIDIAFHGWVIYSLIGGVRAWSALKKLPPEELNPEYALPNAPVTPGAAIRPPSENGRIILSAAYGNLDIIVKRVYGVTELIVNGMVYAEQKGVVEVKYTMEACVDNILITVSMSNLGKMRLFANGDLLASKQRLF